jgi:hypothetical protein
MKKLIGLGVLSLFFCLSAPAQASVYSVWADTTNDGLKDLFLGTISGYEGTLTGRDNYDYYSASGHPINGPDPQANKLKIFMYENTNNGRAFLNLIAGRDGAGTHSFSGIVDITGSFLDPGVVRSDDAGELVEVTDNHFEGNWSFHNNSDGGVIGPLKGHWEIEITPGGDDTLRSHGFYSSDGSSILTEAQPQSYHYFISTSDPPAATTPEPASMALLGIGLAGLARLRRSK